MTEAPRHIPLPDRAVIAVSGPDWRDFLHNLLTQDIETLAAGELRYGALLSPQGRLLSDLFILGQADGCLLDAPADRRDDLIRRLTLYRLRAKVAIAPADAAVAALIDASADPGEGWRRDPRLAQLGWRGYDAAQPADAVPAGPEAYAARRIALAVPDTDDFGEDKAYPIEVNLDLLSAIDFHKGCFIGQETTSRMKRRGQIKSRLLPLAFDGPPPSPGEEVLTAEDLRAGVVASGVPGQALALMRLDRMDGPLTAGGRAVRVARPEWMEGA